MSIIARIIDIYVLVVIAAVVVSWLGLAPTNPVVSILRAATEPVLSPIRGVVPPLGGIDFSPLILIVVLQAAARLLSR